MARCGCDPRCSCIVQVVDGDCVDFSISGSGNGADDPYVITGEILVDGDTVVCGPNGLQASINTLDTDSVDLEGDGSAADPLTAEVILTPDNTGALAGTPNGGENLINDLGPGLYVSCEDVQDCVGAAVEIAAGDCLIYDDDANTISVQIAPEPNGVECTVNGLLVSPSADANNGLVFGTDDRLFVIATVPFEVLDTPCINLTVTGTGNIGDPQVLSAVPTIDPNACNTLICGPAGLRATRTDFTAQLIQPGPAPGAGSPCFAIQETPGCPEQQLLTLALSDDPCQALECRADGLFVPQARGESCISNGRGAGSSPAVPGGALNAGQQLCWVSNAINICNSGCCDVGGMLQIDFFGLSGRVRNGSIITQQVFNNINGGGFQPADPFNERTIDTFQQTGNANSQKTFPFGNTDSLRIQVAPGACITYQSRFCLNVVFGGIASFQASQFGGMNAEIVYTLIPLCDCQCGGQAPSC